MVDFLILSVSAFVLFSVVLPCLGILIGVTAYYVIPYLFGGIVVLVLGLLAGMKILASWWLWMPALAWAALVHGIRKNLKAIGFHVEHHHAASMVLLAGIPYHRKKKQLLLLGSE